MLKTLNFDKVLGMGDFIGYQRDRMTDKQTFNALQYFYVLKKTKTNAFYWCVPIWYSSWSKIVQMKNILMVAILFYNKFYNYDFPVGKFVDFFQRSSFYGNTLLIIVIGSFYISSTEYKQII